MKHFFLFLACFWAFSSAAQTPQAAQVVAESDSTFRLVVEEILPDGSSIIQKSKPLDSATVRELLFNQAFQAYEEVRKKKAELVQIETKSAQLSAEFSRFDAAGYRSQIGKVFSERLAGKWILLVNSESKRLLILKKNLEFFDENERVRLGDLQPLGQTTLILREVFKENVEFLSDDGGTTFRGFFDKQEVVLIKLKDEKPVEVVPVPGGGRGK